MKAHRSWCASGFDPAAFWNETPATIQSAMRGRADFEKRQHTNAIVAERWGGLFAQADPKEHDKLLKRILDNKPVRRVMAGKEIGSVMRAWAAKVKP